MRVHRILLGFWALLALCSTQMAWADSQRHVALISDLHVGAGKLPNGAGWKPIEDFRWQPEFNLFLDDIAKRAQDTVDLVLVGDVFELWQSPTMTCSTDLNAPGCVVTDCQDADSEIGCSETEGLARLSHIVAQHPEFIEALRKFSMRGTNRVYIVPGNHDAALLFPKVRAYLQEKFAGARVEVLDRGYWLSEDGRIYADHGHQFDEVNEFADWPNPFVQKNGVAYLRKPWGENMVQQFYNQYEGIFPIVDNLSREWDGVDFAIKEAGLGNTTAAVGRFARFFIFQQSLRQASTALGEKKDAKWDYDNARKQPPGFFLDVFKNNAALMAKASEAQRTGTLQLDPMKFSTEELDAICAAKEHVPGAKRCLLPGSQNLSAAARGALLSDAQRTAAYLKRIFQKLAADKQPVPLAYVYAHTHSAMPPKDLTITDMPSGSVRIKYANTGAFQRVASKAQIQKIIDAKVAPSVMQIQPEHLPPCYGFVWIKPYSGPPALQVQRWKLEANGQWSPSEGTCSAGSD